VRSVEFGPVRLSGSELEVRLPSRTHNRAKSGAGEKARPRAGPARLARLTVDGSVRGVCLRRVVSLERLPC
jgi:hypothetical protein